VLGKVGHGPVEKGRDARCSAARAPAARAPTDVVAVQRGDGIRRQYRSGRTIRAVEPQWDRQSQWFRRLETEHLKADAAAADNPAGVTSKGNGDTILKGDGASITYDLGLGYVGSLVLK